MCHRLDVEERITEATLEACRLHESAKLYCQTRQNPDMRQVLSLANRLLQSAYYRPEVLAILRGMYANVTGEHTSSDIKKCANILTVLDMYCAKVEPNQKLTEELVGKLNDAISAEVGHVVLPEVHLALMETLKAEALNSPLFSRRGQAMLLSDDAASAEPLKRGLREDGFKTVEADSIESLLQHYRDNRPDVILLSLQSQPRETIARVNEIVASGIDTRLTPTYLLVPRQHIAQLVSLLEHGLEDVVDCESSTEMLRSKIKRLCSKTTEAVPETPAPVRKKQISEGRLNEMSLLDLLKTLGTSGRTVRVTVNANGAEDQALIIYLDRGNLVQAKLQEIEGEDAIYLGMAWKEGGWTIEPVDVKSIGVPNVFLPNETILSEGYRLTEDKAENV
jgi:DNA-binding response OmpR family regulator